MKNGYERFFGFANIYDDGRPHLPAQAIEILKKYQKDDTKVIVDIGCGTGNSTEICINFAEKVIGIDASDDMLAKAKEKESDKLTFQKGFGNNTGLESEMADIVICSQAFHWMEPESTIDEISRILKKGGVFAVIDADTFPAIDLRLEKANSDIQDIIEGFDNEQNLIIYPRNKHLENLKKSNHFEYCKEICFCNEVIYDKEKFKKYFYSKGSLQNAIKNNYEPVISKLEEFDQILEEVFEGGLKKALFSYKIKIGIK